MPLQHRVAKGDSVPSLAFEHGFAPDTIWNHPENAFLKVKRKNMNILMRDDLVMIPDKTFKEVDRATDQQHVFRRFGTPSIFRLQLFDNEKPLVNEKYLLIVDGTMMEGATSDEGVLTHNVPPNAREGKLVLLTSRQEIKLDFGHLDPDTELIGIQKRLNNLGYGCGEPDGELNEKTREALIKFQRRFELPETGQADATTIAKIVEIHDFDKLFDPKSNELNGSKANAAVNG